MSAESVGIAVSLGRLFSLPLLVAACKPFTSAALLPDEQPYGEIKVYVSITGPTLPHRLPDGIVVALDSAIQGYAVQPIAWSTLDSADFRPVPVGLHDVWLRGISPTCSIMNGERRADVIESNKLKIFSFQVNCSP